MGQLTIPDITKKFPVIEIFGPTIAGEGSIAGAQTLFVRFGGCDYRCSWCDSLHAVLPEEVRKNSTMMDVSQIEQALRAVDENNRNSGRCTEWVSLSGGNPALLDLDRLVCNLQQTGYKVNVETQGSKYKPWFHLTDELTVSPKPPSSGMDTDFDVLDRILLGEYLPGARARQGRVQRATLKVVVFDETDLDFAERIHLRYEQVRMFISIGTKLSDDNHSLLNRYLQVVEMAKTRPSMSNVSILPQLHVLLWGHKQGV